MKKSANIILFLILTVMAYQLYSLFSYNWELRGVFNKINQRLTQFKEENRKLSADLEYFQEPENLIKELRGRFNYKKPGEKLIIAVPPKETSDSR